ncbi:AI-2E family transporter [Paraglaciecola sp. L1A13]|uniref:AI-2E family transporter n=1 Tax=Paraglaciecola sp. L1A13 TaxID=2686359 RepID=UPI00131C6C32|nr:AI-2E family transporter [Paraglaciecola sp. L1A13]
MNLKLVAKRTFVQAVTIIAVVLFTWLIIENSKIFLIAFGGILIAVMFSGSARWLAKKTNITTKVWLPISMLAPVLLLGLLMTYAAPKISTQANELVDRMPEALEYVRGQFTEFSSIGKFSDNLDKITNYDPKMSTVMNAASGLLSTTINGLGNFVFAIILALFLSINPKWYVNGSLSLVPPQHQQKARDLLVSCETALAGWLLAKLASMVMVGLFTTIGLWALGIDLALILGIIAALLSFIPNLGPLLAFIPAALVSILTGIDTLLYVSILYMGIQTVESYVLTPILQAEIASLPPALVLLVQVLLASMVGMAGVLLAAPLTVLLIVVTNQLYVKRLQGYTD